MREKICAKDHEKCGETACVTIFSQSLVKRKKMLKFAVPFGEALPVDG